MGCDIHLHSEVKIDEQWHHHTGGYSRRCYPLFSKLADVRNPGGDIEPISFPRGLPDDMSLVTRKEYECWKGDAHSMSFLELEEVRVIIDWAKSVSLDLVAYEKFRDLVYLIEDGFFTDARVVFWFDN